MNQQINSEDTSGQQKKAVRFDDPNFSEFPTDREYLEKGDMCILTNADNEGFVNYARIEFKDVSKIIGQVICGIMFLTPGVPQLMIGEIPKDALKLKDAAVFSPPGAPDGLKLRFRYLPIIKKSSMLAPTNFPIVKP